MDTVLDWQAAYSFTSASEPVHDDDGASDHNDDGERDYHALLLVLRWETIGERHLTARKGSCPAKKAHSKRMVSVIWAGTRLTNLRSLARQSFQGRAHFGRAHLGRAHGHGDKRSWTPARPSSHPDRRGTDDLTTCARPRAACAPGLCSHKRVVLLRGMWLVAGRTINSLCISHLAYLR